MPFIVRLALYSCGYAKYPWYSDEDVIMDLYSYYRCYFFEVVAIFTAAVLAFRIGLFPENRKKMKIFIPLAVYAGMILLSTLLSVNMGASFTGNFYQFQGVLVLLGYLVFCLYAYQVMEQEKDYKTIWYGIVAVFIVMAVLGIFQIAKKDLLDGKSVLFSGTPCQIAGLKQYLKKDYENLLTVDIICHGVPSKRFFQSFMEDYGKKLGGTITEFYFRDKSKGQGMITRSVYKDMTGENKEEVLIGGLTAYIHFFSKSYIYRKNCYSCPFASEKRVGDLTLGDFWGFHEEYPSYDEKQGLSNGKGVSCILVNTNQGKATLEQCEGQFVLMTSDFEKVARHNDQLHSPSKYSPKREQILELYQKEGYEAVDRYFHKNYKKDILKYTVSGMLPKGLKRKLKTSKNIGWKECNMEK